MPDTHTTELRTKPQIWFSHQPDIPEEAEMVTCEDCNGTGLDGEDTTEHRAFACSTCYGHGVIFVLWPEAKPVRKPAASAASLLPEVAA